MNNGLMVPSRVRELVTVMMNDDIGCYVKNIGEATRHWSAVARAITATENKDCLNLFVQLDGLQFIYKWLKDAQKYSNEASDSFVEESITHLLQVLEKLYDGNENMFSSEIWTVVNDLRSHNSLKVQDEAQVLFESWEKKRAGENNKTSSESVTNVEITGDLTAGGKEKSVNIIEKVALEHCLSEASPSSKSPSKERESETACMGGFHPGPVESEPNSDMLFDPLLTDNRHSDHLNSPSISNPNVEALVLPPKGATSTTVSCPDVSGESRELEVVSEVKDIPKVGSSPWNLRLSKEPKLPEVIPCPSSLDAADAMNSSTEPTSLSVSGDKNLCGEGSISIDKKGSEFDGKVAMSNGHANRRQCSSAFDTKEVGEFNHHVLWSSSGGKNYQENLKDEMLPSEDDGKINIHDLSSRDFVMATDYSIFKKDKDRQHAPSGKKSTVNLEYGLLDPLEFARQVAIEVEREVVDYREQSCSSEKRPEENMQPSCSLDSVSGNRSHASGGSSKEAGNHPDLSAESEASSGEEGSSASSKDINAEATNGIQDAEISQVTEASQEETNKEAGVCNFDLNVEVCSEDADYPMNQFTAPVSVVSASRPVAVPGFPTAPLQFEGNLGWKGSASTSAFRPAPSRRVPDIDKDVSTGGRSSSSKNRQQLLDIDLNVAESGDGRTRDLSTDKQVLTSLSLPSGESSVEMKSRSKHIVLDLNLASEVGGGPTDWHATRQLFPQRYFQQTLSNSSSSSIKQPSLNNIDLNDHPFTNGSLGYSHLLEYSQYLNIPGSVKSDDSVISIMGARVEVNNKEFASQTQSIPNGKTSELAFDINSGRTGGYLGAGSALPYVHPAVYGYSNIAPAPGPGLPFSSTVYGPGGPIPYMVDSRGAPVIPQVVGPTSVLPTTFSQAPYLLNTTHSNLSYSVGSSRGMLDLNSGTMMEGGNKDRTSLGLFINSGPSRPMEEELWPSSHPTISSGFGGKRKEPENGWEHYPPKPHTPPWI
ncbi:hypothetical protein F511_11381 [Dorcoceras hygrometricum]|uniref:TFIIS N-terminal domain-containing protein n=1 Tax=Dorcoceras hygrometricum TaxID=472368 RepID=A0A2Z7A520_9LAMI|nr:hypothetical protein F511_11381 [Dorcoceras hygrometricum]